jgi:hypothetical protein
MDLRMWKFVGKCVWNISHLKCLYGTRFYNYNYESEVGEKKNLDLRLTI